MTSDPRLENPLVCHECRQPFGPNDRREDVTTNEPDGNGTVRFKIHSDCIPIRNARRAAEAR